ncbi:MAG: hypothetical protein JW850_08485, partial [Thermoflexales bacterium]|nr:hypothetical protein [Thermoflexales bacterium]
MVTSPLNRNRVYKIVAIALCITLVATLSPPQGWTLLFGVGAAHAAPSLLPTQAMQAALPEMVGPLAGMSTLDPNDIIDMGALRAAAQKEAAAPASPISVSRVQSAYVASDAVSGTLVVTFTVSNNHAPAIAPPQPPPAATITDAVNAVAAVDFSQDPNVIHNVLLVDSLTSHATFVSSSPWPDRRQAQYAWNLGDIPPLGRITATLALSVPASVAAFVELDTGASAWGTLQGRAVSASTTPASLAPDGFGDWLKWTVDADYYDEYAVAKAAELGNDWEQMFGYVRSLGYESYKGSLRGTRGTLWSEAGNSLDQASLLIAMLRGSGVPARYRHGTLDTPRAQELIASMFPGTPATAGYVPPGVDTANPPEDPTLLDETRDHWWVQAYVNGTWTDLDPCFANAGPGETFYASLAANGTDQVAEAPDALRHKVTFTVKIETYHPLNTGYSGLEYGYPLSRTFNAVELVGNP